eukprot:503621-Amphidinium_carterae.1
MALLCECGFCRQDTVDTGGALPDKSSENHSNQVSVQAIEAFKPVQVQVKFGACDWLLARGVLTVLNHHCAVPKLQCNSLRTQRSLKPLSLNPKCQGQGEAATLDSTGSGEIVPETKPRPNDHDPLFFSIVDVHPQRKELLQKGVPHEALDKIAISKLENPELLSADVVLVDAGSRLRSTEGEDGSVQARTFLWDFPARDSLDELLLSIQAWERAGI